MSVSVPSFSLVRTPLSQLETKARAEAGEGPVQTGSPAVPRATGHHRLLSGVLRRTCPRAGHGGCAGRAVSGHPRRRVCGD